MPFLIGGQQMMRKVLMIMFLVFLITGLLAPLAFADGDGPTIATNAQAI